MRVIIKILICLFLFSHFSTAEDKTSLVGLIKKEPALRINSVRWLKKEDQLLFFKNLQRAKTVKSEAIVPLGGEVYYILVFDDTKITCYEWRLFRPNNYSVLYLRNVSIDKNKQIHVIFPSLNTDKPFEEEKKIVDSLFPIFKKYFTTKKY